MSKPIAHEVDCTTGAETIREMTDAEIAIIEEQAAVLKAEREKIEAEMQAKAAAKAAAEAKLAALGLTAEEIAALTK